MTAEERRREVLRRLETSETPVSATALARALGVSRQLIVGDVALLRASGAVITATPRGYSCPRPLDAGLLTRTVACVHDGTDTETELCIMVDNGCVVRDVIVEHPVYGQLTGALELRSRYDVAQFMRRSAGAAPLSSLTGGVHLHTLLCPDEDAFRRVKRELDARGFLLKEE